jgi:hypothetical protein
MAALPAEPLNFADGDALQANVGHRLPHIVEFEWLYDRRDHLHLVPLWLRH